MYKNIKIILILVVLGNITGIIYAHPIMPKPIYKPDEEYDRMGKQAPRLSKKTIAIIEGKAIGKSDYFDWIVDRADTEDMFNGFISGVIIRQKARQLKVKADKKDVARLVDRKIDDVMEKSRNNGICGVESRE